jgi:glycerol uptake facilitator-like aquaporin
VVIESPLGAKLLSEAVGSGMLVAVGLGAAVADVGFLGVAVAHGLVIAALLTATGHVSGGHFNPAITISMVVMRLKAPLEGLWFVLAQLLGAAIGAALISIGTGLEPSAFEGTVPTLADGQSTASAFVLTALGSFLLVWTVYGVGLDRDGAWFRVAGLPIGFAVVAGILLIGPAAGGALATTRWFGPALLTQQWDHALVMVAGPIVGALLAAAVYLYGIRPRVALTAHRAPD